MRKVHSEICTYFSQLEMNDGKGYHNKVQDVSKRTRNILFPFFYNLFGICWWQLWPVKQQFPDVTYLSEERKVISHDESNRCTLEIEPLVKQVLLESE